MEKKRMENKMQDSGRNRKDFLMDMVKRVYSDDMNLIDLDRELVGKLDDFITSEISKAREEGRREQRELDCSLYGSACAEENFDEKWKLEFGMTEEKENI